MTIMTYIQVVAEFNATMMVLKTPPVDDVMDNRNDSNDISRVKRNENQGYDIVISYYLGNVLLCTICNDDKLLYIMIMQKIQMFATKLGKICKCLLFVISPAR